MPRPNDPVELKTCYSGKKKRHMIKNILLISRYPRAHARGTLEEVMLLFSGIHPRPYARGPLRMFDRALRLLFLRETHQGSVHDKRIADTTPYPLPAGSHLLQERGLQAFTLEGVTILQPTKKPRGKELTPEQKADNREVARRRVRIEQVNSSVKRCRMLKETIRMWKAGMRDMVMEIGCGLHNFRVRLTPSWTPMV
jgi:hypothetical protein